MGGEQRGQGTSKYGSKREVTYEAQAGVVRLREDGVGGLEDQFREEDLVLPFIHLRDRVSRASGSHIGGKARTRKRHILRLYIRC